MKQLRIHYLQHVAFEGLGYIETWAQVNNHSVSVTKLYESYILPEIQDFDWLIVMGGPMGVNDTDTCSWMHEEKAFIKLAIDSDKVVVGICLGAQLIASVLGAKVYPNVQKEIGWFPIKKTKQEHTLCKDLPDTFTSFHWHGDTFELPENAVHILQTDVCPNQAFIYNNKVLALQFHLEATPQTLNAMIANCRSELVVADYIQTEAEILAQSEFCSQSNIFLTNILRNLVDNY